MEVTKIIYMIIATVVLISCNLKTKLSPKDLEWVDMYNTGDFLVFESEQGIRDTTEIIEKQIFYPPYNPIEVHDKFHPQTVVVWYKNRQLKYHPEGQRLVTLRKDEPRKPAVVLIDYLYNAIRIGEPTEKKLSKFLDSTNSEIYVFKDYNPKFDGYQPQTIYWHKEKGLIKYVDHNDETWELVEKYNVNE